MRFHIGLSMNLKKALKYILPFIAVGFVSYFINTGVVFADDEPYPCTDSVNMCTNQAFEGWYEIESTDTNCNIFLGDYISLNRRTRQVEYYVNYEIGSIQLVQTARNNYGRDQSAFSTRYIRQNDVNYYVSFDITNLGYTELCYSYGDNPCYTPLPRICYYDDNDLTSYWCEEVQPTDETWNSNTNTRIGEFKNWLLKSNSYINTQKNTSGKTYNHIQFNFTNTQPSDYSTPPPTGYGWEYFSVVFSDTEIGDNEGDWNTSQKNYCANTNGDYESGGGNSVNDEMTTQINDITSLIDNYFVDNNNIGGINLSNYVGNFFGDIVAPNSPLASILVFPIAMVETIIDNNNTCTPYSIDLSSITRRFGGSDYTLTLPCIRSKLQTLLGDWYATFDLLIAGILFYYFAVNLVMKINYALNGEDFMPYFFGRVVDDDVYQTKKKRALSR